MSRSTASSGSRTWKTMSLRDGGREVAALIDLWSPIRSRRGTHFLIVASAGAPNGKATARSVTQSAIQSAPTSANGRRRARSGAAPSPDPTARSVTQSAIQSAPTATNNHQQAPPRFLARGARLRNPQCRPPEPTAPPPTGTWRAAGGVSFRAGAFDAVGDRNPVPRRAARPRPTGTAPGRAECPRRQKQPRKQARSRPERAEASGFDGVVGLAVGQDLG